jgi:hypothetical protein
VFQRYDEEYIQSEVERVRAENTRRRALSDDPSGWGSPSGDFSG